MTYSNSTDFTELEDGALLIPNNEGMLGMSEIETAFKSMPGVQLSLLHENWVRNNYTWIVWKLASYERAFPQHFSNCLNVENIIKQLKYRYDREIDRAERSALRKILEKDETAARRMILCVSNIIKVGFFFDEESFN